MEATKRKEELNKVLQAYLAAPEGPEKQRAREAALKAYEYLIPITIGRYINVPFGVEYDDLEQIGRISLNSALEHYDPEKRINGRTVEFRTYVIACLRKGISRWIHDCSWSKAAAEHEKNINKANERIVQETGRPASAAEIADEMGVSEERLIEMARAGVRNRPLYLHQGGMMVTHTLEGSHDMHLEEVLASDAPDHHTRMVQKEQARILLELADELKGNLRDAALLLFQGYSVQEIGQALGVSASRAGMIVSVVRERLYRAVKRDGHEELFEEWLVPREPGLKPGRVRKRRRRPRNALMKGLVPQSGALQLAS